MENKYYALFCSKCNNRYQGKFDYVAHEKSEEKSIKTLNAYCYTCKSKEEFEKKEDFAGHKRKELKSNVQKWWHDWFGDVSVNAKHTAKETFEELTDEEYVGYPSILRWVIIGGGALGCLWFMIYALFFS